MCWLDRLVQEPAPAQRRPYRCRAPHKKEEQKKEGKRLRCCSAQCDSCSFVVSPTSGVAHPQATFYLEILPSHLNRPWPVCTCTPLQPAGLLILATIPPFLLLLPLSPIPFLSHVYSLVHVTIPNLSQGSLSIISAPAWTLHPCRIVKQSMPDAQMPLHPFPVAVNALVRCGVRVTMSRCVPQAGTSD